jgi:hypothetical protein
MSYAIELTNGVKEKMAAWGLSKRLLDEIAFRLKEDLTENPAGHLRMVRGAQDVLEYSFTTDGGTPDCQYLFAFRIVYSRDRASLVLWDCEYVCDRPESE